ncbi:MAG: GMC family oxidoreductase [Candidatus Moranbacteria bacterium]|nr:GMC family oxidoreductase [Candidatus Moranbacteria bacterium]
MKNNLQKTDILILGIGAAGGVLFGKLAEAGFDVTGLDAGPHWETKKDFVSDEREMEKLKWNDPRISDGTNPLDVGAGTSGRGVGGGTVHYTMMSLRLHPSDFKTKSLDGVGVDWPIDYDELEPYYTEIEQNLPIAGPENFPWTRQSKPYPQPAHRLSCVDQKFKLGTEKLGIKVASCPLALITEPVTGRQPCINRGFCEQGCKPKAKSSTLVTYIPRGMTAGGKIVANAMAKKINLDKTGKKIESVIYIKNNKEYEIECNTLILSAFAVETPRILLNNKSEKFPDGLANSSGTIGKYLMCHSDHVVYAKFPEPLRIYRNPPVTSITQDFYETDPKNSFKRGFSIAPYCGRPISFAIGAQAGRSDLWGQKLQDFMREYNFWLQLGIIGEVLPYKHNRVELAKEKDANGIPITRTIFSIGDNEKKMIEAGYKKMEEIANAAGAIETFRTPLFVHLMGTTRMGNDPKTSVVDENLKSHDLENLFICGNSVFPSSGASNPTLTTQALAARLAGHLIEMRRP